ncbi:hypothetical protein [Candidatus Nitronereus thalassa]|uniref:Copper resistance protein D domain-containing protein n=1 Tax=Candidatus Nitronereus thalassa TaxID=3020898 RepID=A0ABU3K8Q1_9BACT|nr:hypothetical protein [Candidatus Nitronereus thalassa]MDT7042744.1 hypothetical protein [Candidatus Nitronereus thalassa]
MLFFTLVLAPVFRSKMAQSNSYGLFQQAAKRFAKGVWVVIPLLGLTGGFLLSQQTFGKGPVQDWPFVILIKLSLVAILIINAGLHDFIIGPRMGRLRMKGTESLNETERIFLQWSPWFARGILLLGVAVVCAGVAISRA